MKNRSQETQIQLRFVFNGVEGMDERKDGGRCEQWHFLREISEFSVSVLWSFPEGLQKAWGSGGNQTVSPPHHRALKESGLREDRLLYPEHL